MRQVFTSPRLENVEAVAALLRDAGIEIKITDGRSYRGTRRSSFSFRKTEDTGPEPAVWIVRADDQPRGRQLLREAGLIESARGDSSYLPLSVLQRDADTASRGSRRRMGIKLGLLVAIVAVIGLMAFTTHKPDATKAAATAPSAPAPKRNPAPAIIPQAADDLPTYRADVPTALAILLLEDALSARKPGEACIAVDGKDPTPALLQGLARDASVPVVAASRCSRAGAVDIDIRNYMTDGSGSGTVQVSIDAQAPRGIDVTREGERWRVLRKR